MTAVEVDDPSEYSRLGAAKEEAAKRGCENAAYERAKSEASA